MNGVHLVKCIWYLIILIEEYNLGPESNFSFDSIYLVKLGVKPLFILSYKTERSMNTRNEAILISL